MPFICITYIFNIFPGANYKSKVSNGKHVNGMNVKYIENMYTFVYLHAYTIDIYIYIDTKNMRVENFNCGININEFSTTFMYWISLPLVKFSSVLHSNMFALHMTLLVIDG